MNIKVVRLSIFIATGAIVGGSFFLGREVDCGARDAGISAYLICEGIYESVIEPILWSSLALFVVSIFLFFVRRETFILWSKFAAVAFPVMLGILLYTYNNAPRYSSGWFDWGTDDQFATGLLPSLFVVISLGIILVSHFRSKKQTGK